MSERGNQSIQRQHPRKIPLSAATIPRTPTTPTRSQALPTLIFLCFHQKRKSKTTCIQSHNDALSARVMYLQIADPRTISPSLFLPHRPHPHPPPQIESEIALSDPLAVPDLGSFFFRCDSSVGLLSWTTSQACRWWWCTSDRARRYGARTCVRRCCFVPPWPSVRRKKRARWRAVLTCPDRSRLSVVIGAVAARGVVLREVLLLAAGILGGWWVVFLFFPGGCEGVPWIPRPQ